MLLNEKDHKLTMPKRNQLVSRKRQNDTLQKPQAISRVLTGGSAVRALTDEDLTKVPLEVFCTAIKKHILADAEDQAIKDLVNQINETPDKPVTPEVQTALVQSKQRLEELVGATWDASASDYLCALRTGCIGALAIDAMAAKNAKNLAVIGTGKHAEAHLLAALTLREFEDIRIYGRRPVAANDLAKIIRGRTNAKVRISASPEEAVHHADIVLLVTNSGEPMVDADWVSPEAHVSTIGPKVKNRHEVPAGILWRAKLIASDVPQQIIDQVDPAANDRRTKLRVKHLGNLFDKFDANRERSMTLFVSSGLGGTEVVALKAAANFLDHS